MRRQGPRGQGPGLRWQKLAAVGATRTPFAADGLALGLPGLLGALGAHAGTFFGRARGAKQLIACRTPRWS
jgi:hypothetical protein